MKVLIQLFFLLLIFGAEIRELQAQQDPESAQDSTESKGISEESKYQEYKELFGLYCVDQKGTDNYGEGIEALYGTRNFRPILHGVAYRGGGNNYYHRTDKRNNKNPLPPDGLQNLANLDFSTSVYLYTENFETAPSEVSGTNGTMSYQQISGNTEAEQDEILALVHESILNQEIGPVYLHCWNGWHQSGYISAIILRQFCGLSASQALQYWAENADGWNKGYQRIRTAIAEFKPRKQYQIEASLKEEICPCMSEWEETDLVASEKLDWIQINMNRMVPFGRNSSEIDPGALTAIDDYIEFLNEHPYLTVEVGGHSSLTGSAAYNQKLSQTRAETVMKYMVSLGVDPTRLTAVGYGQSQPVMRGTSDEANQLNRRIQFRVTSLSYQFEFALSSAEIRPIYRKELIELKEILSSVSNAKFLITGHTDDSGTKAFNDRLSEMRAKSVYDFLKDQGFDVKRCEYKGMGSSSPVVPNTTDANRNRNRRIEIAIIPNSKP
ncbi:MAG: OmpA family protein [Bacteroidetes bacterium]|nr:OmpA family protein [Bacteroidota bacterium]MDA1336527.1 OmpA family protein [Bacteroidota bacterium]